jgi:hypothetical protein
VHVTTPEDAIELLHSGEVEEINLNHDLGVTPADPERTDTPIRRLRAERAGEDLHERCIRLPADHRRATVARPPHGRGHARTLEASKAFARIADARRVQLAGVADGLAGRSTTDRVQAFAAATSVNGRLEIGDIRIALPDTWKQRELDERDGARSGRFYNPPK